MLGCIGLATALRFRFVRAVERRKGNTDLTLTQIIARTFEDAIRRGAIQLPEGAHIAKRICSGLMCLKP